MARMDRREKLALEDAYCFSKAVTKDGNTPDLYKLANSLKTIENALKFSNAGQFKLTTRLWKRIQELLFDKLITSYPAHIVVFTTNGQSLSNKEPIPDDAVIEIHPEGLRRADDVFRMEFCCLHPITQLRLRKAWIEGGAKMKPEDIDIGDCKGVCVPKSFIIGDEVLLNESQFGKQHAYEKWWELYWQAYCTNDRSEKQAIEKEMAMLEAVWGDLYY